ncbi:glycosyltransferase family 9 protein [Flavobacterium rhizosphaerae]|uniref:Glycosyltransferase family 9 protein n=1 Tax=Flavobacterium rhizosphaerae TaxID=3163298 RepID=A0ABW8YV64_9FLAO
MSFKARINKYRRYLTRSLTKNIGGKDGDAPIAVNGAVTIKKVLVIRPNHRLGNLLLVTPLMQELASTFPGCSIDIFVKGGLTPIVFQNYPEVKRAIQLPKKPFKEFVNYLKVWFKVKGNGYDLVVNVSKGSSSGRIATTLARAKYKVYGDEKENLKAKYPDYLHMAKFPVYNLRYYLSRLGFKNDSPVPLLDLKLSESEFSQSRKILAGLTGNTKPVISIFTYATGAKCYKNDWWEPFYQKLQAEFPDYSIVEVLPAENVSQIDFKAPSYYSRDIREIAAFIANTKVFIGADSGIMHLASASLTPTVGLFAVTNPKQYQPYGNKSVALNTATCSQEQIIEAVRNILPA